MASETVFVKMLNDAGKVRDSYTDYWTMVTLSGYKHCLLSEVDFASDNVYLFSPDDGNSRAAFMTPAAKERRCKLVLYQLEWPHWESGTLVGHDVPDYVDEMWACDWHLYYLQKDFNPKQVHKVRYTFFGGHPQFGDPGYARRTPIWDICHLLYIHGIREHKLNLLSDRGYSIAPPLPGAAGVWGEEREYILRHSRWGLHLQQFPMPFIAPQRFMLFASYGLPILTDYCADPAPYAVFQDALLHFDPKATSVMNPKLCKEAVEFNFNLVRKDMTFRDQVDRAVYNLLHKEETE